jgi:hypothetical protein
VNHNQQVVKNTSIKLETVTLDVISAACLLLELATERDQGFTPATT